MTPYEYNMDFTTSQMPLLGSGDNAEETRRLAEEMTTEMRKVALPVTVIVGVEAVLGFVGNLFVLYVFLFKYHMCNFRYFVLCLAITDLTSTLTTMPGEIVTQTYWYTYPVDSICKIKSFFNIFTVGSEALCLLLISVDRFRKICRPMEWQIKPKHAFRLCFVIYAIAVLVAIPCGILWGTQVVTRKHNDIDVTVTICLVDDDYDKTNYPLAYSIITEALVSISLVIMLVLYIFIARALVKRRRPSSMLSQLACIESTIPSTISACPQKRTNTNQDAVTGQQTVAPTNDLKVNPTEPAHEQTEDSSVIRVSKSDVCDDGQLKDQTPMPQDKPTLCVKVEENGKCHSSETCAANGSVIKVTQNEHVQSTENHRVTRNTTEFESAMQKKTLIMFILTVVFIITTILYLTLLSLIATDILQTMTNSNRSAYFFFFRLYFINHVINPFVYGFLDSKFRKVMADLRKSIFAVFCRKVSVDKRVNV